VSTLRCVHVCNLLLRYLPEIDAPTLLNLLLCLNVCELLSAGYSHLLFFLNLPLLVSALQCAHVLSETKGNLVNVCSWKPTDQNPGKLACPGSFLCPDLAKSPDNNSCAHVYLVNVCAWTPTDQNPGKLACPGSFLCPDLAKSPDNNSCAHVYLVNVCGLLLKGTAGLECFHPTNLLS
jgi:hypothetical protein